MISTSTDYILDVENSADLCREFLKIGIPISLRHVNKLYSSWRQLRHHPYDDPEDIVHDSECAKMVMVRSEIGLKDLLAQEKILHNISGSEGRLLYSLASVLGWVQGCQLLWSYSVPLVDPTTTKGSKYAAITNVDLFELAARSEDVETLEFWLDQRWTLSAEEIEQLGSLDDAINVALTVETIDTLLESIIQQRRALRNLAEQYLGEDEDCLQSEGLLDMHACTVLDKLSDRCINVHPSLRPTRRSIWYIDMESRFRHRLYEVGFCDFTSAPISPLLYGLTITPAYNTVAQIMEDLNWIATKTGASLDEKWPNSDTTALHCLAWALAWSNIEGFSRDPKLDSELRRLLLDPSCDGCSCGCSTSGCQFMTILARTYHEFQGGIGDDVHGEHGDLWTYVFFVRASSAIGTLVSEVLESTDGRLVLSEFIRFAVFTALGLSHTCCEIFKVSHAMYEDFDISKSPCRYSPKEIARIRKEDTYLLGLLEELVAEFDELYDLFRMKVELFFDEILTPRMDEVLEQLAREDEELYVVGRREMGVVMEVESESGSEDDDDEGTEEESSEEESD